MTSEDEAPDTRLGEPAQEMMGASFDTQFFTVELPIADLPTDVTHRTELLLSLQEAHQSWMQWNDGEGFDPFTWDIDEVNGAYAVTRGREGGGARLPSQPVHSVILFQTSRPFHISSFDNIGYPRVIEIQPTLPTSFIDDYSAPRAGRTDERPRRPPSSFFLQALRTPVGQGIATLRRASMVGILTGGPVPRARARDGLFAAAPQLLVPSINAAENYMYRTLQATPNEITVYFSQAFRPHLPASSPTTSAESSLEIVIAVLVNHHSGRVTEDGQTFSRYSQLMMRSRTSLIDPSDPAVNGPFYREPVILPPFAFELYIDFKRHRHSLPAPTSFVGDPLTPQSFSIISINNRYADPVDPDDPDAVRVLIPLENLLEEYIAENTPETLTNTVSILLVPSSTHLSGSTHGPPHLIVQWRGGHHLLPNIPSLTTMGEIFDVTHLPGTDLLHQHIAQLQTMNPIPLSVYPDTPRPSHSRGGGRGGRGGRSLPTPPPL